MANVFKNRITTSLAGHYHGSFCHTLGEFGVVLMIGGNIAGETRTLSIAIYDSVLAFDHAAAQQMSMVLLMIALVTVTLVYWFNRRLMQI